MIALATQTCGHQQGGETATPLRHNPVLPGRKCLNYCYRSIPVLMTYMHCCSAGLSPFLNNKLLALFVQLSTVHSLQSVSAKDTRVSFQSLSLPGSP
ncbi:hypothetical protein E2C01_033177 [Portunus trituberculatus]|uniref:Uncharacterized protein n=1 Tax=Portunus trituberculatus TaxID=210409 RepID=A0A5B7EZG6_PORTR|nr:hypothetical protein [Portunus trituberculatus]